MEYFNKGVAKHLQKNQQFMEISYKVNENWFSYLFIRL